MWANVLIFTVLAVVSSRNVPYKENSDIVAIIDNIFAPRNISGGQSAYDVKSYHTYATSPGKTVHPSHHGGATTEAIDQYVNQFVKQWFHHEHRSSNGHVNCENHAKNTTNHKTDGRSGISNKTNTQRPVNVSTNLYPRSKANRNSTKTIPVTRNISQNSTFQANGRTNASVENATLKNVDKSGKDFSKDRNEGKTTKVEDGATKTNATNIVDEDRWIWDTSTTEKPSTVGLGDRAAFSGDECPSGKVKLGNVCVDED